MERRLVDFPLGENLVFEKSPFYTNTILTNIAYYKKFEDIEDNLKIDPPSEIYSFTLFKDLPKSNLLRLTFNPPSECKTILQQTSPKDMKKIKIDDKEKEIQNLPEKIQNEQIIIDFIALEKWFIRINAAGIARLCGFRANLEEMWMSDYIMSRIDSTKIISISNICYELIGPIDSRNQNSSIISSNFKDGFPENWKDLFLEKF